VADSTPNPAVTAPAVSTTGGYQTRQVAGWTVHLKDELVAQQKSQVDAALVLMQRQLEEIMCMVPPRAVEELQKVTIWFSPEYPGVQPRAEYHPSADWLRDNKRNPAMARGVELTNTRIFAQETDRMPNFMLHELAHAYHDQVLPKGFDNAEITAAYEKARAGKTYDKVERWLGNGRPNTVERAYAMTSPQEYFAESTEAFFSRNDFFPFARAELEKHDAEMFSLLQQLWIPPSSK
jgi:hypothetical protein